MNTPAPHLKVQELAKGDVALLLDYWYHATPEYMRQMGADPAKLPDRPAFGKMLLQQITLPYSEKAAYATIWMVDGKRVGHCNLNKIEFGSHASLHLHLWHPMRRGMGLGQQLVLRSLPYFFDNMQLKRIFCEPYALNPAPNKTLEKIGFSFVKRYTTVPGSINFEQEVNRWELTHEQFLALYK